MKNKTHFTGQNIDPRVMAVSRTSGIWCLHNEMITLILEKFPLAESKIKLLAKGQAMANSGAAIDGILSEHIFRVTREVCPELVGSLLTEIALEKKNLRTMKLLPAYRNIATNANRKIREYTSIAINAIAYKLKHGFMSRDMRTQAMLEPIAGNSSRELI